MDLSEYKDIMKVIARLKLENEKLDKIEERFKKFNILKRYQNGQKQPLADYKERLQEFMEMTWREESKKKREREYFSLNDWMREMTRSSEQDCIVSNSLSTCFKKIGTQISNFFMNYLPLIVFASNASNHETVSLFLDEVITLIQCLNVEENGNKSFVIDGFDTLLRFLKKTMELIEPFWYNETNKKEREKTIFYLNDEIEDEFVHRIINEVLRLEVSFFNPEFITIENKNFIEVFHSMAEDLESKVFKDKLKRISDKINEHWSICIDPYSVQESNNGDSSDYISDWYFSRVLSEGIQEIWREHDPKLRFLVNLVLL